MKRILFFISIVLTSLAFLPFNFGWVVFFSLAPFFYILEENSEFLRKRLITGFFWGFAVSLSVLYWINSVTCAGYIALSLYHSLYIAVFAGLWGYSKTPLNRALIWVVLEYLRSSIGCGSPYGTMGTALAEYPLFIQIASFGGVLLVSFWIVFANILLAKCIKKKMKSLLVSLIAVFLIPVLLSHFKLNFKDKKNGKQKGEIKVAVVQPNIGPSLKWNFSREKEQYDKIKNVLFTLPDDKLDLIVLPETVFTGDFRLNKNAKLLLRDMIAKFEAKVLFGSPFELSNGDAYNSAFLVDQELNITGHYSKNELVPFGEYIPFEEIFPKMKLLTPIDAGFLRGQSGEVFTLKENICFSSLICFEDTLSGFVRDVAENDIDFLITITNDGWFPGLYGPLLHDRMARFRAVENGMNLLRCSNTGVSSWIGADGGVINKIEKNGKLADVSGVMVSKIKIYDRSKTLFSLIGYSWIWILMAVNIFSIFFSVRRKSGRPRL